MDNIRFQPNLNLQPLNPQLHTKQAPSDQASPVEVFESFQGNTASVYIPGKMESVLPKELSENVVSLHPLGNPPAEYTVGTSGEIKTSAKEQAALDLINDSEVHVEVYKDTKPSPGLLHRKVLIVDGQEWMTSGSNFGGGSKEPIVGSFNRSSIYTDSPDSELHAEGYKDKNPSPGLLHRKMLIIDGQEWRTPGSDVEGGAKEPIVGSFNRSSVYADTSDSTQTFFSSDPDLRLPESSQHEAAHKLLSEMRYTPQGLSDAGAQFEKILRGSEFSGPFDNGPVFDPKTGTLSFYNYGNGDPDHVSPDILAHEGYHPYKKQS